MQYEERADHLITHLLFDFFGTLVTYSDSRTEQGFERSYAVLLAHGATCDYSSFLARWENICAQFELAADVSYDEYSMDAVVTGFLTDMFAAGFVPDLVNIFRDTYLQEWNKGVKYIEGISMLMEQLQSQYKLVLVTNTHHAALIRTHLQNMKIADYFSLIVTSVEFGKRKPHPSIFQFALQESGAESYQALYIGDSYKADYLGAQAADIRCLLIDPSENHNIASQDRLLHLLDLQRVLSAA